MAVIEAETAKDTDAVRYALLEVQPCTNFVLIAAYICYVWRCIALDMLVCQCIVEITQMRVVTECKQTCFSSLTVEIVAMFDFKLCSAVARNAVLQIQTIRLFWLCELANTVSPVAVVIFKCGAPSVPPCVGHKVGCNMGEQGPI